MTEICGVNHYKTTNNLAQMAKSTNNMVFVYFYSLWGIKLPSFLTTIKFVLKQREREKKQNNVRSHNKYWFQLLIGIYLYQYLIWCGYKLSLCV